MFVRRSIAFLGALGVVALVGCASDDVQTSVVFDPLSAFPATATYVWDARANKLPDDDRIEELDLDPLLREAANQEFSLRGYRVATSGTPDYRLSYQLAVHTWIGPNKSTSVASLSLMLVNVKRDRRVWIGYGRADVHIGITREERLAGVRAAFAKMLKDFPPNQGAK